MQGCVTIVILSPLIYVIDELLVGTVLSTNGSTKNLLKLR